ncbi:MAG: hypothetical protein AB2A00_33190 [Myxococcota bacterium]
MPLHPSRIIGAMSQAKFSELMAKSPRQVRETLFNRLQIKAEKKSVVPRPHQKNEERIKKLHVRLAQCPANAKNEQELCEELIRNWLVGKTPMLVATLDHFGVKHENGLTETEIDFFEKLEPAKVKELVGLLAPKFDAEEMAIYLRFLKVPHLRGMLPAGAYPKDAPAPLTEEPETVVENQAAAG